MKTDLSHLPHHKQAELKAVVSSVIPRFIDIEMIILFGSHARGNWVEDIYMENGRTYGYKSDFDLLIVLSNNSKADAVTFTQSITGKFDELHLPTPVHPIFHGIEFVNNALKDGSFFFGDIKEEGVLLFTTNRYHLEDKRVLSPYEVQARAKDDFDEYFESANRFFKGFKFYLNEGDLKEAAFILHQATERYYNTIQLVFTGYKPKTHDLEVLSRMANSFDMRFIKVFPMGTEEEANRFILLRKAYVDARYKKTYTITKADLEYLSDRVIKLKELTEQICKDKIKSFIE